MTRGLIGLMLLACAACTTPNLAPASLKGLRAPAASRANPTFVQGQPAELLISQQFILHSQHVGADYLVQVAYPVPPPSPEAATAGIEIVDRLFPNRDAGVIYVLDGAEAFPARAAQRGQHFVVGIQPTFGTLLEAYNNRFRDLTHDKIEGEIASGGGAKFEAFIRQELRPFIEARFPVDPKKSMLSGYSLGGMFVLRVLADDPDAFAGYLVGDPSTYDATINDRLRRSAPLANGQRVYVGVADLDRPGERASVNALMAVLEAQESRLVVKLQEFPGEDHMSASPFVGLKGTAWLFSGQR